MAPGTTRPLVHVAEDLVRSLDYRATISSFDEEVGHGEGKQPPSRPEILLVDRWALQDEDRRRRLAAFDAENRPWATTVVPWSREDRQSMAVEAEPTEKLGQTMPGAPHRAARSGVTRTVAAASAPPRARPRSPAAAAAVPAAPP
ncbi:FxsC protein [Streptomyces sp. NPDC057496]|uniref:FxsC protein n=1 Tax=Streptomyces sp. NPDC057496 TaxID=3346149 RepID=UPI0036CA3A60